MKRWMILCSFAALASLLAGCRENREQDDPSAGLRTIVFRAGAPDVKTAFGESDGTSRPTLWTDQDTEVRISLNYTDPLGAGITPSSDHRSATFSVELDPSGATSPYTFYAVSPASAAEAMSPSRSAWRVRISSVQTPVSGSVDEGAQILSAKSASFTAFPSEVSLHFSHATAYGRISLQNLSLGDAAVSAVELTCSTPIVGEFYYSCEDGTFTAVGESSTLRINTSATDAVWFACAPVDVSGETMRVSVITDKGVKTKEITFPSGRRFASGKIAGFGVDMAGIDFSGSDNVYSLVTSAGSLAAGDEVLILNSDETYVLGTNQKTSNREAVSVPSGKVVNHSIKEADLPAKAQVLTLGAGKSSGSWTFSPSSGKYLTSSNKSKNKLLTGTSVDDYSSFTVSIASDGVATIKALTGDWYWLHYNPNTNNGDPLFSCYSNDNMDPVCLFRKSAGASVGTDDPLLAQSRYGAYLSDDTRMYSEGEDQYSREYNSGVLTFTILHPSDNEQLEITGYRKTYVKGDAVTVTLAHRKGLTSIKSGTYNLQVVGEDGSKVWLGDGSGKGFIIKK